MLEELIAARADMKQECKVVLARGLFHRILEEAIVLRADVKQKCKDLLAPGRPTAAWRK